MVSRWVSSIELLQKSSIPSIDDTGWHGIAEHETQHSCAFQRDLTLFEIMVSEINFDTMIEKLAIDNALILKEEKVLTDTKLRNLKPQGKMYKVPDREGLYVAVTPKGSVSFRYNYSMNGRQETLTLGLYGDGGITLNEARERLNDAKRLILKGVSPAREKARSKERISEAKSFGEWAELWLRG